MKNYCKFCGIEITYGAKRCRSCYTKNKRGQLSRSRLESNRYNKKKELKKSLGGEE